MPDMDKQGTALNLKREFPDRDYQSELPFLTSSFDSRKASFSVGIVLHKTEL